MAIKFRNLNAGGAANTSTLMLQLISQIISANAKEKQDERRFQVSQENTRLQNLDGEQTELDGFYSSYKAAMNTGDYDLAEAMLYTMEKYRNVPDIVMPENLDDLSAKFIDRRTAGKNQDMYYEMYISGQSNQVSTANNFFKNAKNLEPHILKKVQSFKNTDAYRSNSVYSDVENAFSSDVVAYNQFIKPFVSVNNLKTYAPREYKEYVESAQVSLGTELLTLSPVEQNKKVEEYIDLNILPQLRRDGGLAFNRGGNNMEAAYTASDYQGKMDLTNYLRLEKENELRLQYNVDKSTPYDQIPESTKILMDKEIAGYINETLPSSQEDRQKIFEKLQVPMTLQEITTRRKQVQLELDEARKKQKRIGTFGLQRLQPERTYLVGREKVEGKYGTRAVRKTGQEIINEQQAIINPLQEELDELNLRFDQIKGQ